MTPARDFCMCFVFKDSLDIQLPNPVHLRNHEVAVKFISMPKQFFNMPETWVKVRAGRTIDKNIKLPAGYCHSMQEFVHMLNNRIDNSAVSISYDDFDKSVNVKITENRISIQFSPFLAGILRFDTGYIKGEAKSVSPVSFSGEKQIFVLETNITEPTVWNGRQKRILGLAAYEDSSKISTDPIYFPVKQGNLEYLHINMVTTSQLDIEFLTGATTLVLHFREQST